MFKLISAAALAVGLAAGGAQAATLLGDDVQMTITNTTTSSTITRSYTVGAGFEETGLGAHMIDFDWGLNSDKLNFTVEKGSYCGFFVCSGGTTSIVFSGLDFSMGHELVGFQVYRSAFSLDVDVLSPNSIAFSFAEGAYRADRMQFIKGKWLTEPAAAPVPLPAAGWMLVAALGGLGLVARRKRQA